MAVAHEWLSRATLTGAETAADLAAIVAHFTSAGVRCHVEWNLGHCDRPDSWDDTLGRLPLDRGFRPGGFRCVWAADPAGSVAEVPSPVVLRQCGPDELEPLLDAQAVAERQEGEGQADRRWSISHGEADGRWHRYVGTIGGVPCCNATMFIDGPAPPLPGATWPSPSPTSACPAHARYSGPAFGWRTRTSC